MSVYVGCKGQNVGFVTLPDTLAIARQEGIEPVEVLFLATHHANHSISNERHANFPWKQRDAWWWMKHLRLETPSHLVYIPISKLRHTLFLLRVQVVSSTIFTIPNSDQRDIIPIYIQMNATNS